MSIGQSVVWNWAGIFVSGFVSFVAMPIMIDRLGNFYYGIWVLLNTFVGYYGVLDFGITSSLRRFASRFSGADDGESLHEIVAAGLQLSVATAAIIILLTSAIAYRLPGLVKIPADSVRLARILFAFMGVSVAIQFPVRTLGAYLQGLHRFDLYNLGFILTAVLRGACIIAALWAGYGVIAVAVSTLSATLFSLVFFCIAVRRLDPGMFSRFTAFSWPRIRELFTFSFFVFIRSIGDYFRFQMDSFVVARYLAVALVTPFSVASTLMTYFMSVMFSVSTPLMSMASQLDGAQRYRESRRFFLRATKLTTTVATLGGVLLICNGKTLLTVWLGKDLLAAYPVVVILTLAYVSDLGQCTSINLLCSRGRHQPLAYWTVLEGLANLGLSIYWAPHYGIIGVALGTTIPMLVTKLIVQPWYTLNVAEVSGREYLATIGRPLFVGLFCLATSRLMPVLPGQLWVLCFSVMWQSLLFGLLSYIVVLNADERRSLVSRFTKNVRLLPAAT